jgi:hypothetical protein
MKNVQAAVTECSDCDCSAMYEGPLEVGASPCKECNHPLLHHVIRTHAATAADPASGIMPDGFELFPQFR